jgi:hypothetical protein
MEGMEGWEYGGMGVWSMEGWEYGVWRDGSMGVWEYGGMGVWEYGSMGVWRDGSMEYGGMGVWSMGVQRDGSTEGWKYGVWSMEMNEVSFYLLASWYFAFSSAILLNLVSTNRLCSRKNIVCKLDKPGFSAALTSVILNIKTVTIGAGVQSSKKVKRNQYCRRHNSKTAYETQNNTLQ